MPEYSSWVFLLENDNWEEVPEGVVYPKIKAEVKNIKSIKEDPKEKFVFKNDRLTLEYIDAD